MEFQVSSSFVGSRQCQGRCSFTSVCQIIDASESDREYSAQRFALIQSCFALSLCCADREHGDMPGVPLLAMAASNLKLKSAVQSSDPSLYLIVSYYVLSA